jgi:hypothetical protein
LTPSPSYSELLWLDGTWHPEALHKRLNEVDGKLGEKKCIRFSPKIQEVSAARRSPLSTITMRAHAYCDVILKILNDRTKPVNKDLPVQTYNETAIKIFNQGIKEKIFRKTEITEDSCLEKIKTVFNALAGFGVPDPFLEEPQKLPAVYPMNESDYEDFVAKEKKLSKEESSSIDFTARASDCCNTIIELLKPPFKLRKLQLARDWYNKFVEEGIWRKNEETRNFRLIAYDELRSNDCTKLMEPAIEDEYKTLLDNEALIRLNAGVLIDPVTLAKDRMVLIQKILESSVNLDPETEDWYGQAARDLFNEAFPEVWLKNKETKSCSSLAYESLKACGVSQLIDADTEEIYQEFLAEESSYDKEARGRAYWYVFNILVDACKELDAKTIVRYKERAEKLSRKASEEEIWDSGSHYILQAYQSLQFSPHFTR